MWLILVSFANEGERESLAREELTRGLHFPEEHETQFSQFMMRKYYLIINTSNCIPRNIKKKCMFSPNAQDEQSEQNTIRK